jgi:hypothetical protein
LSNGLRSRTFGGEIRLRSIVLKLIALYFAVLGPVISYATGVSNESNRIGNVIKVFKARKDEAPPR